MTLVVKVGEAKTRLSELLHRVEAGEDVVLSRGPVAVARLTPFESGGRRAAAFSEALDARDSGGAGPATAAELGLWRGLASSGPPPGAAPRIDTAHPPPVSDGPDAPPGADEHVPRPDASRGVVIDSTFAAAWLLPGPDRRVADALADRLARSPNAALAVAPTGFWAGLGDVLLAAALRDRIGAGAMAAQFARAGRLPIVETSLQDGLALETEGEARAAILRLAASHGLSFSDAACLAFARARGSALACNLPGLARVAARLGVPVFTDLSDVDLA